MNRILNDLMFFFKKSVEFFKENLQMLQKLLINLLFEILLRIS